MLAPVVLARGHLGLVDVSAKVLEDVADRLDERADACRPSSESFVNPAKMLAADLAEGVPVVLGDGPLNGVAAMRAASMLARTARMPAMCGELPDDAVPDRGLLRRPVHLGVPWGRQRRDGRRRNSWRGDRRRRVGGGAGHLRRPLPRPAAAPRLGLLMLRDFVPETPMTRRPPRWTR